MPTDRVLQLSLEGLVAEKGVGGAARYLIAGSINAVRSGRVVDALLLATLAGQLKTADEIHQDETFRCTAAALSELSRVAFPDIAQLGPDTSALAVLERVQDQAKAQGYSDRLVHDALLGLALRTRAYDTERLGLQLLDAVGASWRASRDDQTFLRIEATLSEREAVNQVNASRPAVAIGFYADALRSHLNAGASGRAREMLARLMDLSGRDGDETRLQAALALTTEAPNLEARGGPAAAKEVRTAWQDLLRGLLADPAKALNVPLLLTVVQAMSAAQFAAMRSAWTPLALDTRGRSLLEGIAEARRQLAAAQDDAVLPDITLDEDLLLTAVLEGDTVLGSETARERLTNLEKSFDAHVTRLLTKPVNAEDILLSHGDLQKVLGDRTTLLIYAPASTARASDAMLVIALTSDDMAVALGQDTTGILKIRMSGSDLSIAGDPFNSAVGFWRDSIRRPPGPRDVSRDGAAALGTATGKLLGGGIAAKLKEWRKAGKDHLVVMPFGGLHYFPFQLLGGPDRPLADDWTVTMLPHLSVLKSTRSGNEDRQTTMTSLALSFEGGLPHGLSPLPKAHDEARDAAAAFGGTYLAETEATPEAMHRALATSRVLHVATHGRHRVTAPGFQTLYLSPDAESDGEFHAWEVLTHDLSEVALVGLSACETALGRIDAGDNPRGLPANLLMAGAETVIGTLWEVRSDAARTFFRAFYQSVANGAERRDAFGHAQRRTRAAYPEYRDWAAFYMTGVWSAI